MLKIVEKYKNNTIRKQNFFLDFFHNVVFYRENTYPPGKSKNFRNIISVFKNWKKILYIKLPAFSKSVVINNYKNYKKTPTRICKFFVSF